MDNNNSSFLDRNTLLAVGLSILFFIGWQQYMETYFPSTQKTETVEAPSTHEMPQSSESSSKAQELVKSDLAQEVSQAQSPTQEQLLRGETSQFRYILSSKGMGLKEIELLNYTDRAGSLVKFVAPEGDLANLATSYRGQPIWFSVEKVSDNHFVGQAQVGEQIIQKEIRFDPARYTFELKIQTLEGQVRSGEHFSTHLSDRIVAEESSFFAPSYEGTEFFAVSEGSEQRERLSRDSSFSQKWKSTTMASVGSQYFAVVVKDSSAIIPTTAVQYVAGADYALAELTHEERTNGKSTEIQLTAFIGPKKYDLLKSIDAEFTRTINYGIFSFLCKPMLMILKWFYELFKNWGLAIIALTILVRVLLLPINISSLKSMKKMQKIQPQMKAIREKFKDDPQRMNMETMALMKREKANPLGGCLPMLMQLPVFFALYSVLGQSVELYKSPFMFWIHDLSYKDPYFVLPVAVGALYFLQMNITPQPTMDPAQAKMMKFIPILFSFFMFAVPSGLTLYFFVNTVFGIGQQLIFQREKNKVAA